MGKWSESISWWIKWRVVELRKRQKLWGLELAMILLAAIWFIPIYYLIVTTFKSPQEANC